MLFDSCNYNKIEEKILDGEELNPAELEYLATEWPHTIFTISGKTRGNHTVKKTVVSIDWDSYCVEWLAGATLSDSIFENQPYNCVHYTDARLKNGKKVVSRYITKI